MTIAEYMLHADQVVAAAKADQFEGLVAEFLDRGGFARLLPEFEFPLVLGLRTPEPFEFFGNDLDIPANGWRFRTEFRLRQDRLAHHYFNVFRLPDLQDLDLARSMLCCADDPLYTRINALVSQEFQYLRTRVKFTQATPAPAAGKQYYRVERQFQLRNLGAYLFGIGACFPALEQVGWKNLGIHQAVTGELNTLVEFWELPAESPQQDVLEVLQQHFAALYEMMVKPYPAQASAGDVFVDASYATGARLSTPAPPIEQPIPLSAAS
ncbi:MAG TPA: hypothetical protein VJU61_15725 [Polyangiaceae bacterium]|nr:hypothetical protein [Polyangiaceae bacterium]